MLAVARLGGVSFTTLLSLLGVGGFDGVFLGFPPAFVAAVPVDGLLQTVAHAGRSVGVLRLPAEFAPEFARIHRIAQIMSWTIIDVLVPVAAFAHEFADQLDDHFVVNMVVVGANDVGFTHFSFVENQMHGRIMVVDVDPVTDLLAGAVEFGLDIAQDIGDLAWDELFNVLIGAIIVATV